MRAGDIHTTSTVSDEFGHKLDMPRGAVHALRTSTRPSLVFLRFSMTALFTAGIDNLLFYLVFRATGNIAAAQVSARIVSMSFNYRLLRFAVFRSDQRHHVLLSRYLPLVAVNTLISYECIRLLSSSTPLSVVASKVVVETTLFIANFVIQRFFVFAHRPRASHVS